MHGTLSLRWDLRANAGAQGGASSPGGPFWWLEGLDIDDLLASIVINDSCVFRFAQREGAVAAFARLIDVAKLEAQFHAEFETLNREHPEPRSPERRKLFADVAESFEVELTTARKALLEVDRVDDETRLAVLLASLLAAFAPNTLAARSLARA